MSSTLYSSIPTSDSSAGPFSRPLLSRFNSLASWTNPFLSRFPSLSTSIGSLKRVSSSLVNSSRRTERPDSLYKGAPGASARQEEAGDKEEEENVGLVQNAEPVSTPSNPFDDSHAVPSKPLWHRAIVAGVILAALVGLGLGIGIGAKKAMTKVREIESSREESLSLAHESTSKSKSSTSTTSSSASTSPSSSFHSSASSTLSSTLSTHSSPTSIPTNSPSRDDVLWAVSKTM